MLCLRIDCWEEMVDSARAEEAGIADFAAPGTP